ncbi:MAG TPA: hypothetical protein VFB38_17270 [Chthonomonadaceae bacterium]|nr:hypothetical protein [Chthonomonadaceae bacterium]
MSVTIRAHYAGKVIVPDEPVDLPVDQPLEIELKVVPEETPASATRARKSQALERLLTRAIHGLDIPAEALRREHLDEEMP